VTIEEVTRLTQRFAEAINAGDRDGWVACFDPGFSGYSALATSETGQAYHGLEGAGAWFDNLFEVYDSIEGRLTQTLVVADQGFQIVRVRYVGRASGLTLDADLALVSELDEGGYRYLHSYLDLPQALRGFAERIAT
jgi:ketosteroid isomerase-like protein